MNLSSFNPFKLYQEVLEAYIKDQTDISLSKPVFDNENLKRDFRFSLGRIQGLKDALNFFNNCKEMVEDDLL